MIRIVGVRFQKAGKIYYFDPLDFELETAMHVIVETARGIEMGTVLIPPKDVEDDKVIQPLKPVIRVATDEDERVVEENKEKEKDAFAICKEMYKINIFLLFITEIMYILPLKIRKFY